MTAAEVRPQVRKLAEDCDEHPITRRQRVRDRCFPSAGAGSWKQKDLPFHRLEHLLEVVKHRQRESRKIGCALIFERDIHRLTDAEWHIRRAGNKEAVKSCHQSLLRFTTS